MIVYRIGKTKWSNDVSGDGSRINGGKWNNIGIACIYTSSSRAVCLLEYSVHTPLDLIPRALSFTSFEIPEDKVFECNPAMLPGNWTEVALSRVCMDFGSKLLKQHLVVKLPSVVLPYEPNYLLNPSHLEFTSLITIIEILDYSYDLRIKQ